MAVFPLSGPVLLAADLIGKSLQASPLNSTMFPLKCGWSHRHHVLQASTPARAGTAVRPWVAMITSEPRAKHRRARRMPVPPRGDRVNEVFHTPGALRPQAFRVGTARGGIEASAGHRGGATVAFVPGEGNMDSNAANGRINRRDFLVGASTAVVGSGLLAAGWPHGAAAASGETQPPPAQPERATENGAESPGLSGLGTGSVQANGLEFHYVEAGQGPLALCLHGFPDSPFTYRYLLPALAAAGYHAVCP